MNLTGITDEASCDAFVKGIIKKDLMAHPGGCAFAFGIGPNRPCQGVGPGRAWPRWPIFFSWPCGCQGYWDEKEDFPRRLASYPLCFGFGLMGSALAICLYFPSQFSVAACAVGLFAVQFCLFLDNFWRAPAGRQVFRESISGGGPYQNPPVGYKRGRRRNSYSTPKPLSCPGS